MTEDSTLVQNKKTGCPTGRSSPVSIPLKNPINIQPVDPVDVHLSTPIRYIYIILGVVFFGFGVIGTVLPLIPTTPLVILSAVCFGKSSRRLHLWCISTRFYRNNVESFVKRRSMTKKAKATLLASVTIVMGSSFIALSLISAPAVTRIILIIVWLCHIIYFGFRVKTVN